MAGIVINNVAYNWSMVQVASAELAGSTDANPTILQGVSALSWNKKREVKNNYGLGGNITSRGFGNKVCEAKITMDYNTQVQLRGGLPSLMDIGQFDLIVSFADPVTNPGISAQGTLPGDDNSSWTTETVTIKGCVFNEDGFESEQDDDGAKKEFDLNPLDIIIA